MNDFSELDNLMPRINFKRGGVLVLLKRVRNSFLRHVLAISPQPLRKNE